ncbi:MAG: LON peptidase substrate-binding domain-containing protein [Miltoncostaeaceae bacterium]
MSERTERGIFPLDMVLLPGEEAGLHLFEPRYRQLYADCVLDDDTFVIARAAPDGHVPIGCAVRFDELRRRHGDGRLDVVIKGVAAVRVVTPTSGRLYNTAQVEPLYDQPAVTDDAARLRLVARYLEFVGVDPYEDETLPLSYGLASTLPLGNDIKQALLEEREEPRRVELLTQTIERALREDAYIAESLQQATDEGLPGRG